MGIETRQAPLSVHQKEFGNVLETLRIHCADYGVEIEPNLHLALSKKGADHRIDIINALLTARNLDLEAEGLKTIPLIDDEQRKDHPMRRNIRTFQWFVRSQMAAAGWIPEDVLTPPNNRDVLDLLRKDFDLAGIQIQLNRGLLKASTHEAGMYRIRIDDALNRLHRSAVAREMGSEFAAAVSTRTVIWQKSDALDHPVYANPGLLMERIRRRNTAPGLAPGEGDFS